jgi:hypothetical protein
MSGLDELGLELRKTGIPAARRRRILAELADHLASDPASEERLGSPAALAPMFAVQHSRHSRRRQAVAGLMLLAGLLACAWIIGNNLSTPDWAASVAGRASLPAVIRHIYQTEPWHGRLLYDPL